MRLWIGTSLMRRPTTRMSPEVGCTSPAIDRRMVVLPQPEGPSRVTKRALVDGEADVVDGDKPAIGQGHGIELDGGLGLG